MTAGQPAVAARPVGRPRRLTLETIVDAACEVGVANLDMALVAERLKTGVATLYGYVKGRDHLLQLMSERLTREAKITDRGQSWQDIVREHAAITYALFQAQPELITNLMGPDSNPNSHEYWSRVFAMLKDRGIPRKEAIDIYIETNQIVIGAAVCRMRRNAIEALRATEGGPKLPYVLGNYKPTLERIILDYEDLLETDPED